MSNWGRIRADFWRHEKTELAGLEAIGLWTVCNSWTREKRTAGFIPYDVACELAGDEPSTLTHALCEAGLWIFDEDREGFLFKDYLDHNGDLTGRAGAAKMVADTLKGVYPAAVITSLANKVDELLQEGQDPGVLRRAVKTWGDTAGAGVGLLPYLVADVIRTGGSGERNCALREAWKTGDMRPLAIFGLVFTPPDMPREITTVADAKEYMLTHKRAWIEQQ